MIRFGDQTLQFLLLIGILLAGGREFTPTSSSTQTTSPPQAISNTPETKVDNPWAPTGASRDWRYLVVHHTASAAGNIETIDRDHRRRTDSAGNRWLGIGYHFLIGNGQGMPDGQIEPTFRWRKQLPGAHAGDEQHNAFGIGVCLVGDFTTAPPSERQLAALERLLAVLASRYKIGADRILAHRELKPTDCPGRSFPYRRILGRDLNLDGPQTGGK